MRRIIPLAMLCLALTATSSIRADSDGEASQKIINRAIEAIGGNKAVDKHKIVTIKDKGTFYGMGEALPYQGDFKMQLPGKSRMEILNVFTIVVNEDEAWVSTMGQTIEIEGNQLEEQRKQLHSGYIGTLVPLANPGKKYRLSLAGEEEVDGEPCDGVKVDSDKHRSVRLLFSRKTGLLRKFETVVYSDELSREVDEATIFGDYRDVDGAKVAFKTDVIRDGKIYVESEATEVTFPKEADPNWFTKP